MPDWNREPIKFRNAGLSTASPTDLKGQGKYRRLSNVRSREDGSLQARPGLSPFNPTNHPGTSINSMRKLTEEPVGSNLLVVGDGNRVGLFSETLPFQPLSTGFSGNPLSIIAWRPELQGEVWAYVYDSLKQVKFDKNATTAADVFEIGIAPPGKAASGPYDITPAGAPTVADGGAGDLSGTYQTAYRYRSSVTGVRSEVSDLSAEITVGPNGAIQISNILASADPQVDEIEILSIGGTLDSLTVVDTIANGVTTYLYTTADILLTELVGETQLHKPWVVTDEFGVTRGGVPLPYVWGPFQHRLLATGAPSQPGTVFWTNGNDPDSMDPSNYEEVTGTNEPLINGIIWDTNSFVFSNSRMFATYPNVGGLSIFRHLPTPVKRGLIAPWCAAAGDKLYFVAKDGVFSTQGGPEKPISDDIYNLFPHEGALDEVPATMPNPGGFPTPELRTGLFRPDLMNLDYDDGFVRFTFLDRVNLTGTLVWDKFINGGEGGWYNDFYLGKNIRTYYGIEGQVSGGAAQEVLCGSFDGKIYKLSHGHDDDGEDLICEVWTPFEDRGDPNARKRWGDAVLDYVDGDLALQTILAFDDDIQEGGFREPLATHPAASSGRVRRILDINNGHGRLARNMGLLAAWTVNSVNPDRSGPKLYAWIPASITKPEDQVLRTIEWHHPAEGVEDVYVWGVELWIDTGGEDVPFELWADNAYTGIDVTFNSSTPIQGTDNLTSEQRLRRTWVGSSFRHAKLLKLLPKDHSAFWRLFKVNWLADPAPPLLPDFDTNWQKPRADCDIAYITGLWVEADTLNQVKALRIQGQLDGDITTYIPRDGSTIQHSTHKKTWLTFDEPFRADLVRISSVDGIPIRYYGQGWIAHCEPPLLANWDATFRAWERPHIIKGVEVFYFSPDGAKTANVQLEDTGTYEALTFPQNGRPSTIVLPLAVNAANEFPRAVSSRLLGTDGEKCFIYRVRWLADPEPEQVSNFNPVWTNDGSEGAKFLQGAKIRHDTRGLSKEIVVDFDNGGITPVTTLSSPRMDTDIITFDPPFITHSMRLRSTDADNGFLFGVEWVWEPAPDLASLWHAQESTFDFPGWIHLRRGFLAYSDATAEVRLIITTSEGVLPTITLPLTGPNLYTRAAFEPIYNKWLWARVRAESDQPFRLFKKDCEFYMKPWGSSGPYQVIRPFGDYHRADGARI